MTYGIIGLGNMAMAIIRGMLASSACKPEAVLGYTPHSEQARAALRAMGGTVCQTLAEAAGADTLLLAIKPQVMPSVLEELRALDKRAPLIISIAAGLDLAFFEKALGKDQAVARVMPNINARIGASTSAFAASSACSEAHRQIVRELFATVGSVVELPEKQFSAFSAIAGASPAFSYMYIDALARAAVKHGLPKQVALEIATSAVHGSAAMLRQSEEHPFALIDQVCSPGGITIEGVCALQAHGFEKAVHSAVDACIARDKELSGSKVAPGNS